MLRCPSCQGPLEVKYKYTGIVRCLGWIMTPASFLVLMYRGFWSFSVFLVGFLIVEFVAIFVSATIFPVEVRPKLTEINL
jgi:hypothetical protein